MKVEEIARVASRRATIIHIVLALTAALCAGLVQFDVPIPGLGSPRLRDAFVRTMVSDAPADPRLLVVEVDDASLEMLGEYWPLSRRHWASLVDRLHALGAAAVGIDVVFDRPTHSDSLLLGTRWLRQLNDIPENRLTPLRTDLKVLQEDQVFAEALAGAGNVVLGAMFFVDAASGRGTTDTHGALAPMSVDFVPRLRCQSVTQSLPALALSAASNAAMNVLLDRDGVARRYPFVVQFDEVVVPSLALATLKIAFPDESADWKRLMRADGGAPILIPVSDFDRLTLGDVLASQDPGMELRKMVAGRVVLVGPTITGVRDRLVFPEIGAQNGIYLHASAANALLTRRVLHTHGWGPLAALIEALLLLGAVVAVARRTNHVVPVLLVGLVVGAAHLGICSVLASRTGLLLPIAPVEIGVVAMFAAQSALRISVLRAQRRGLLVQQRVASAVAASEAYLQTLLAHVGDCIIVADRDGLIQAANRAARVAFGDLAKDATVDDLFDVSLRTLEQSDEGRHEVEARRADGTVFAADVSLTRIEPHDECLLVVRDLTESKSIEKMRARFVSTVTHELRTPVAALQGALGLLRVGVGDQEGVDKESLMKIIESHGQRLGKLVDDILDADNLAQENIELNFEVASLAKMVDTSIFEHVPIATDARVTLAWGRRDDELLVRADSVRMQQIFTNLLSNAIKFSPPDSVVRVDVLKRGDERVRLEVADQGPGIPEEFQPFVFERFARAKSVAAGVRGSGLGLSIVAGLVEAHGGEVGFETSQGQGTTFYVDLPMAT